MMGNGDGIWCKGKFLPLRCVTDTECLDLSNGLNRFVWCTQGCA